MKTVTLTGQAVDSLRKAIGDSYGNEFSSSLSIEELNTIGNLMLGCLSLSVKDENHSSKE